MTPNTNGQVRLQIPSLFRLMSPLIYKEEHWWGFSWKKTQLNTALMNNYRNLFKGILLSLTIQFIWGRRTSLRKKWRKQRMNLRLSMRNLGPSGHRKARSSLMRMLRTRLTGPRPSSPGTTSTKGWMKTSRSGWRWSLKWARQSTESSTRTSSKIQATPWHGRTSKLRETSTSRVCCTCRKGPHMTSSTSSTRRRIRWSYSWGGSWWTTSSNNSCQSTWILSRLLSTQTTCLWTWIGRTSSIPKSSRKSVRNSWARQSICSSVSTPSPRMRRICSRTRLMTKSKRTSVSRLSTRRK